MESTHRSIPRLRLAAPADAAQIAAIYAPFCLETAVSFETPAPDEGKMRERISVLAERYPWLVAVSETGDLLGYAYAGKHRERAAYRWSVDFTVYLAPEAKRRGIGTALYRALMKICQSLGYYRAFAGITLPNEASVRLHEKIGFRAIGVYRRVGFKLGRWHDVGWWSLDLLPQEDEPREPRSIAEIVASGELEEILGGEGRTRNPAPVGRKTRRAEGSTAALTWWGEAPDRPNAAPGKIGGYKLLGSSRPKDAPSRGPAIGRGSARLSAQLTM